MSGEEKSAADGFDKYRKSFIDAMDDDLNTADGISAVFELVTAINTQLRGGATVAFAAEALRVLSELTDVLGILREADDGGVDAGIQALADERQRARADKNWARADEIRDELKAKGYTIKDTPQGVQIIKD